MKIDFDWEFDKEMLYLSPVIAIRRVHKSFEIGFGWIFWVFVIEFTRRGEL